MTTERGLRGIIGDIEKKFGLPQLSQVTETLERIPDEKHLRLLKDVLVAADRVSKNALELDQVVALLKEINSIPIEKLEKVEKVLKRIEGILKKAPQDLLGFLSSLKEE